MALGVACNRDAKVLTKVFTNVLDKVERAREPSLCGGPLLLALGWVSAQGDDVADAPVVRLLEGVVHGLDGIPILLHVGAREVHVRDVSRPLQVQREFQ